MLLKVTAGGSARLGPARAVSLRWESILPPLTASMTKKSWAGRTNKVETEAPLTESEVPSVSPTDVGQLMAILSWTVFGKRW